MSDLFHECGIAAVYQTGEGLSSLIDAGSREAVARVMPRLLLDIQNRGQLAAGMTRFDPAKNQILDTHKEIGGVSEVFHLAHKDRSEALLADYSGVAAIGHTRYATCGRDDRSYAQPFERHHIEKRKWFAFAFNGQLANYRELREELLAESDFHLSRETDTEIIMHLISREISRDPKQPLADVIRKLTPQLDGAYNLVLMNAVGEMIVSRDPLGFRPLCYAVHEGLFLCASESVALANFGVPTDLIKNVEPGEVLTINREGLRRSRIAEPRPTKHCFFEWIYFANVASTLDERSVYLVRKRLGEQLAAQEEVPIDGDTIVVPVPDTAKGAADAMAYKLGVPSLEGLIRNRYVGRTFIEGGDRMKKAKTKYTPLREVMGGKRVFVVEDTIVRSTTMRALVSQIFERGGAKEVHVRVACPPIVAPCFYGIDMSSVGELYAPKFLGGPACPDWTGTPTPEQEAAMAETLGANTLRYLSVDAIAAATELAGDRLCRACINCDYPTPAGERMYELALKEAVDESRRPADAAGKSSRMFDRPAAV